MNPVLIKSWLATQWSPGDEDCLAVNNINYTARTDKIPFAQGKSVHYIAGRSGLFFQTNTEEQEMLVRLKFEPGLILLSQVWITTAVMECTLSEINLENC